MRKIKCSFNVKGFFDYAKQVFPLHEKSSGYAKANYKYESVLPKIEVEIKKEKIKPKKIKKKKYLTWSYLFLKSEEWKLIRKEFLNESEKFCVYCGSTNQLQVDHILPKSKYKHLALDKSNFQILCWPCNKNKGTKIICV